MLGNSNEDSKEFKNLLNGHWVSSKDNEYIEIKSPLDNSLLGKVPAMSTEEVDAAILGAKEAQKKWKLTPMIERAELLYKVADILLNESNDLEELLIKEIAKDRKSAKAEIERTADFIKFTADTAKNIHGESIHGDSFPGGDKNKIAIISREPLGVVLAISPFNYPINLAASKIAPAIVAGNTVVFKPATQGSLCGLYLANVFDEAGIPAGVINTVTGKGSDIGDYIVSHDEINFINFTGSTEVGCKISQLAKMIPTLMELGGKDAAIVLKDANLELAAKDIVDGAYSYSGQRCTAIKRVLVENEVADKLVKMLEENIKKLTIGDPLKDDVKITPLIDEKSADFVEGLIEDAVNKGGKIIIGGNRDKNLIYPTLIDNVTTDMKLAWEEPFGPVLPILRVNNIDEALEISNKSKYGLQSSVFTENINDAFYIANNLEVGTVQINNKTERGPDNFPFLGVKSSGIGVQGIRYSIEAMTRLKNTVINLN